MQKLLQSVFKSCKNVSNLSRFCSRKKLSSFKLVFIGRSIAVWNLRLSNVFRLERAGLQLHYPKQNSVKKRWELGYNKILCTYNPKAHKIFFMSIFFFKPKNFFNVSKSKLFICWELKFKAKDYFVKYSMPLKFCKKKS